MAEMHWRVTSETGMNSVVPSLLTSHSLNLNRLGRRRGTSSRPFCSLIARLKSASRAENEKAPCSASGRTAGRGVRFLRGGRRVRCLVVAIDWNLHCSRGAGDRVSRAEGASFVTTAAGISLADIDLTDLER